MKICGLMNLTLLDFPGYVACTIFLGGCNFKCPYCHNAGIAIQKNAEEIPYEEVIGFLKKRRGVLDGVCITGGEPLMNDEVIDLMREIKGLGFMVKLDTNGYFPEKLREVVKSGFCDYIAMDLKNTFSKYSKTTGIVNVDTKRIKESIEVIRNSGILHEFRTTVVKGYHTAEDIGDLTEYIKGEEKYFIQPFKDSDSVYEKGLEEFSKEELSELLQRAHENIPFAQIRG